MRGRHTIDDSAVIIGLMGKAGSGKDTVGRMIVEELQGEARCISFAEPLKRFCKEVFDFTDEQLWGPSAERSKPDERYPRGDGFLTPRFALQTLGTEWGRGCYENVWLEYAIRRAQMLLTTKSVVPKAERGSYIIATAKAVVITDCRFLNEAKRLAEVGEVWQIERHDYDGMLSGEAAVHESETSQDMPEIAEHISKIISNDGTLDELRERVKEALSYTI